MMNSLLPDELVRTASLYFEGLGTPLALGLSLRLKYRAWDEISDVSLDPRNYLDRHAASYLKDALAVNFLRKLQQLPTTVDRRASALEKWKQGERDCYRSNERLERYLPEFRASADREAHVEVLLGLARKIVKSWIGNRPDDLAIGRFGPGTTYSDRGRKSTVPDKMSGDPSLTRGAIWYLPQWLSTQWGAAVASRHGKMSFVPGNRFTTVPKTCKTDRPIAMEPSINVFYQLALGRQLRLCLRRHDWDLDYAQDIHRQVACESSVSREFATLDLSNASDTVCRNLVRLLIPHQWFEALDSLRSPKTLVDGKWVVLEKFSSMGNGFTFELETILFGALACAATQLSRCGSGTLGKDVFCFGDDIIVKSGVVPLLKPVLEFCGLTLNKEKSFYRDEPFRESCGGDYFAGHPVRPFFLKNLPNEPQDNISLANGIREALSQLAPLGEAVDLRAWFSVLDCIPSGVRRCRGPKVLGDIVIHDDFERWTIRRAGVEPDLSIYSQEEIRELRLNVYFRPDGIRYIRAYVPRDFTVVRYEHFKPEVVLACATYGCGNRQGGVIPRNGVRGYGLAWVPYS